MDGRLSACRAEPRAATTVGYDRSQRRRLDERRNGYQILPTYQPIPPIWTPKMWLVASSPSARPQNRIPVRLFACVALVGKAEIAPNAV
jgi:hypothetical protein